MGAYEQALPMLQRVLQVREQVLGSEHPAALVSLNNLAALWTRWIVYPGSPIAAACLEVRERILGPDHPNAATSLSNLAVLHQTMGAYEQALPLLQRALQISEQSLGPRHPTTINNLANMGLLYLEQRDYATAESISNGVVTRRVLLSSI